jgi:hypothetical protein
MVPGNPRQMREIGMRRLLLAKRWILAGSVALTGALAAVAANAFPGKTIATPASKTASEQRVGEASSSSESPGESSSESLTPPAQAPTSGEVGEAEQGSSQPPETPVISGGS